MSGMLCSLELQIDYRFEKYSQGVKERAENPRLESAKTDTPKNKGACGGVVREPR